MEHSWKNVPKLGFGLMRLPMLEGAVDIAQFKQLVLSLAPDCTNAYVLDGGGSTQLVFLGEWYNNVTQKTKQNVRKLSDIVYFATLVDSGKK